MGLFYIRDYIGLLDVHHSYSVEFYIIAYIGLYCIRDYMILFYIRDNMGWFYIRDYIRLFYIRDYMGWF